MFFRLLPSSGYFFEPKFADFPLSCAFYAFLRTWPKLTDKNRKNLRKFSKVEHFDSEKKNSFCLKWPLFEPKFSSFSSFRQFVSFSEQTFCVFVDSVASNVLNFVLIKKNYGHPPSNG
jgi:hypothetical protein